MAVRFLISTLKPGVDPAEYERWVRDYDYRVVATAPNYKGYRVHRIASGILGYEAAGWQYIEKIDVSSVKQHDTDLTKPEFVELRNQLYGKYLDRNRNIYFTTDEI